MKFLLRSLLVLAIAAAFGIPLYFAVQALPGDSSASSSSELQRLPGSEAVPPENPRPKPGEPENNRRGGIRWRSILGLARRVFVFTVMVFFAILAKNLIFERKPKKRNLPD